MKSIHLQGWTGELATTGNAAIAENSKTAFLCSRRYPASAVLRIYDWAKSARDGGECVVSGFHSALEHDVLDILLRGEQPMMLAAARGLPKRYPPEVKRAIDNGRLLVVSPFDESVRHITAKTSRARNQFMLAIAARIVIGHAGENSGIAALIDSAADTADKPIKWISRGE